MFRNASDEKSFRTHFIKTQIEVFENSYFRLPYGYRSDPSIVGETQRTLRGRCCRGDEHLGRLFLQSTYHNPLNPVL